MSLVDEIQALAARIPSQVEYLRTEEATKNALIMPFINALGYNVFDPTEVVPEFTCDFGIKKGEKVDYAIMKDGKPIILFECKTAGSNLGDTHSSQLYRYFSVTVARFGILTNGVAYRFHSDLDQANKMDSKPFFEFSLLDLDDGILDELSKFTKASFDLESNIEAASELKYTKEIKRILSEQLREPSEDFVKIFASQISPGRMTQARKERFAQLTKQAFTQFITDRVYSRLKSAMASESDAVPVGGDTGTASDSLPDETGPQDARILTTEDELRGFYMVEAILREIVDVKRVYMRDVRSYCSVLLDDNNRKPICRLRFNRSQKYIGLFNNQREEEIVPIDGIDDIYQYADRLKATVTYLEGSSGE